MNKIYLSANQLLKDSWRLAMKIYNSGFHPDFILGVWRGGTPVAIAVHELLVFLKLEARHAVIRASSYTGIDQQKDQIEIEGLHEVVPRLTKNTKLLIVDDIFDTGRSIEAIINALQDQAKEASPEQIQVATTWYKPSRNLTLRTPDFFVEKTADWVIFPHELVGLTKVEAVKNKTGFGDILNEQ